MLGSREAGERSPGPSGPPSRTHPGEEKPPGRAGPHLSGLVSWKRRPCRTSALFAAANTVIWFVAFSSCRVYSLLGVLLALLFIIITARDAIWTRFSGAQLWSSMTTRIKMYGFNPSTLCTTCITSQIVATLENFLQCKGSHDAATL